MLRTDLNPTELSVRRATLDTPRVLVVEFSDGTTRGLAVAQLPTATGPEAQEAEVIADGDAVELHANTGDFVVLADELAELADDGQLGSPELAEQIGARIRSIRQQRGFILRDVEALTGIAVPNLSTLEAGKALPRLDTLMRLAEALNIRLAALVADPSWTGPGTYSDRESDPTMEAWSAEARRERWFREADQDPKAAARFKRLLEEDERVNPSRGPRSLLYVALSEAHRALDDVAMYYIIVNGDWEELGGEEDEDLRQHVRTLANRLRLVSRLADAPGTTYPRHYR